MNRMKNASIFTSDYVIRFTSIKIFSPKSDRNVPHTHQIHICMWAWGPNYTEHMLSNNMAYRILINYNINHK